MRRKFIWWECLILHDPSRLVTNEFIFRERMEITMRFECSIAIIVRRSTNVHGIKLVTVRWSMRILMPARQRPRQPGRLRRRRLMETSPITTITIISNCNKYPKCHLSLSCQIWIKSRRVISSQIINKMSPFLQCQTLGPCLTLNSITQRTHPTRWTTLSPTMFSSQSSKSTTENMLAMLLTSNILTNLSRFNQRLWELSILLMIHG